MTRREGKGWEWDWNGEKALSFRREIGVERVRGLDSEDGEMR